MTHSASYASQLLRIPALVDNNQMIDSYMSKALYLALHKTESEFGVAQLTHHSLPMSQTRQLASLNKGEMDIAWTIYSPSKTKNFQVVPFPTLAGLSSYRVLLIKDLEQLSTVNTGEQLKSLTAVQSKTWRDYALLKAQGFKVQDAGYLLGFSLLKKGFVDYYPRSLIEVQDELNVHSDLATAPNLTLHYASFMVFFTNPQKPQLNTRITKGLEIASSDGSLMQLLTQQTFYQEYLKFVKGKKVIEVEPEEDEINKRLAEHPFTQLSY